MDAKDTDFSAEITLTIDEKNQRLAICLHDPDNKPFLHSAHSFDRMRDMGFDKFSKLLGEQLIFANPSLLELFEADIRATKGQTGNGDVQEPSVDELEQALLAALGERRKKVAMIVMAATRRFTGFWDGSDADTKVDEALARLRANDNVLSFGDTKEWRHSEMCIRSLVGDE